MLLETLAQSEESWQVASTNQQPPLLILLTNQRLCYTCTGPKLAYLSLASGNSAWGNPGLSVGEKPGWSGGGDLLIYLVSRLQFIFLLSDSEKEMLKVHHHETFCWLLHS
jgi:hypothetical protein